MKKNKSLEYIAGYKLGKTGIEPSPDAFIETRSQYDFWKGQTEGYAEFNKGGKDK